MGLVVVSLSVSLCVWKSIGQNTLYLSFQMITPVIIIQLHSDIYSLMLQVLILIDPEAGYIDSMNLQYLLYLL